MITYEFLQSYWWFLISLLGAILVFLLFVQGGQTLLSMEKNELRRTMLVNSIGRKWEFTFTTLVVFGGAFFASFPLFYSTSFGGAYWLWMLILIGFVLQAVSYEYRKKKGNIFGTRTYDLFLALNGSVSTILLGVAVAMFFFGGEFTINKSNILDSQAPVISSWASTHGLEAIFNLKNLLLGFTVLFLARTQALLYFINSIDDNIIHEKSATALIGNGAIFVILFLSFMAVLLTGNGYQSVTINGVETFVSTPYKYWNNFIEMWWVLVLFLIGVVLVLYAIIRTAFSKNYKCGIWFSGIGTVLVVLSLFFIAGYNGTAYYPSITDPSSSLSIRNSSSSEFTLTTMSWVSLIIPFVLAYIIYAWRAINKKPITAKEMEESSHKY
ncbi:MAG: cytochrome d ubiquinol oxidase subunit II [Muribaculaceae bacterium]|nr:cytochrome d ubiquinol oxidase subunit II [Muribaculaceae bacterium]